MPRLDIYLSTSVISMLTLFLVAALLVTGTKSPVENQLAAIRADNAELAYSYTSRTFQIITSFEEFTKFMNEFGALKNNERIVMDERKGSEPANIVNATLISRNYEKTRVSYHLIRENQRWKIESIAFSLGDKSN